MSLVSVHAPVSDWRSGARKASDRRPRRPSLEAGVFLSLLAICNLPLVFGNVPDLAFDLEAVRGGDWWRVLTHGFAHVSLYHLLLDAGTFPWLYRSLIQPRMHLRWLYVGGGLAGSLAAAVLTDPALATHGLAGLSGISHGLFGIVLLEMIQRRTLSPVLGTVLFSMLVLKAAFEAVTGDVFLAWVHLGDLGMPMAVAHTGGLLGGLLVFLLVRHGWTKRTTSMA